MSGTAPWAGTRYEQCERKIRHNRLATARRAIVRMRRGGKPVAGLAPYRCLFCDGWHVGNQRKERAS